MLRTLRTRLAPFSLAALLTLCAACSTRSISDSGYEPRYAYGPEPGAAFYKGELDEAEVLGLDPDHLPTDAAIAHLLDQPRTDLSLLPGDRVMVVQSGAAAPDDAMVRALEQHVRVSVFSGVPLGDSASNESGRLLRAAAAQAGTDKLLVYWGVFEGRTDTGNEKLVSWIPIVGWNLDDEEQHLRIRLRLALVDVRTGRGELLVPEAFSDSRSSSLIDREESDQDQVELLKDLAYADAAAFLMERCGS